MNPKKPPPFKASQLYDWHSEPAEERGSSFFFEDSTCAAPTRRRAEIPRVSSLGVAIVVTIMLGAIGLVAMARLLQD
jgi:hypothetical protein